MDEDERNGSVGAGTAADKADDNRRTRSIRFSDSEWEEVKRMARAHELPAAEYVRRTILGLGRASGGAGAGPVAPALGPLIERMFRYTWFLATEKRGAMLREGRGEELEKLVGEARAFEESLREDAPD